MAFSTAVRKSARLDRSFLRYCRSSAGKTCMLQAVSALLVATRTLSRWPGSLSAVRPRRCYSCMTTVMHESQQIAAEHHDRAAHAHRTGAEHHGEEGHLTGHESSRLALEHS